MILFVPISGKEADTAINLSRVLSIEKREVAIKEFVIYICFDLRDDYYKLHFDSKEERDNKFDEYTTAWKAALEGAKNEQD